METPLCDLKGSLTEAAQTLANVIDQFERIDPGGDWREAWPALARVLDETVAIRARIVAMIPLHAELEAEIENEARAYEEAEARADAASY